ncbi:MAG: D-aminoacyl-tRNA deacylase [Petrotogales bacterium]
MVVVIVSSLEDPASTNIKKSLLEQSKWNKIGLFDDLPVYRYSKMEDIIIVTIKDRKIRRENLDKEIRSKLEINPKQMIFISRHRSKMGKPTLTVHPIGNYGEAQFGGKPKTLVTPAPRSMTHLLRLIKKNLNPTDLDYQVCYEVTHHGPYLETPTLFAEVGSTEEEWNKKEPARIIAQSILELLEKYHYEEDFSDDIPVLLGIGGGHYAPRFTDIVFEKKAAFGHMIPSYHIKAGNIDDQMFEKALESTPNIKAVYIHKKALKKSQVTQYKKWFQNKNISVISSKELPALD